MIPSIEMMDSLLVVCSTASVGRRRDDWELEESILFRDDDDDDDDIPGRRIFSSVEDVLFFP